MKLSDFEYVTVGSSAGGYAAVCIGNVLRAKYCISISGQFFIANKYENSPLLNKVSDEQKSYFSLRNIINNSEIPVYYFCPYACERDRLQYEHIVDIKCVKTMKCRSKMHGYVLIPQSIIWFLSVPESELRHIFEKYNEKILDERIFLIKTMGLIKGSFILANRFYRHHIKKFNK